jgi:hypothetical protein
MGGWGGSGRCARAVAKGVCWGHWLHVVHVAQQEGALYVGALLWLANCVCWWPGLMCCCDGLRPATSTMLAGANVWHIWHNTAQHFWWVT